MNSNRWFIYLFSLAAALVVSGQSSAGITGFKATGHDSRIDLVWNRDEQASGYNIYSSHNRRMAWMRLNFKPHKPTVYSDFLGENNPTDFPSFTFFLSPVFFNPDILPHAGHFSLKYK
ncbi:MAG: hypothetical protein ACYS6K_07970 [Planctomycetota bacterium]|jgi:hypothetical protein